MIRPVGSLERFHPAVQSWFGSRLGEATAPQAEGWPLIGAGRNVLIAAPTGSGKTLAGFLSAIDSLFQQGSNLPAETQVVYISPLRALSNDIQKGSARVKAGQRVKQGDPIAAIGASGSSMFPHLHFELQTGPDTNAEGLPSTFHDFVRVRGARRIPVAEGSVESGEFVESGKK